MVPVCTVLELTILKYNFHSRVTHLMNTVWDIKNVLNPHADCKYDGKIIVKYGPIGWYRHPYDWQGSKLYSDDWDIMIYVHPQLSLNISITTYI